MVTVQWLLHRLYYMHERHSCWVGSDLVEVVPSQFILRAHNVAGIDPSNVLEVHGEEKFSKKCLEQIN